MWMMCLIWFLMFAPLFFFPGCVCCDAGSCSCPEGNEDYCYEVTIAGVTNNTCPNCAPWNRTFVLIGVGACIYQASTTTPASDRTLSCQNQNMSADLRCESFFERWELSLRSGGTGVEYVLDAGSFDPDGSNEFSLSFATSACQGWPATVTLEKVACP